MFNFAQLFGIGEPAGPIAGSASGAGGAPPSCASFAEKAPVRLDSGNPIGLTVGIGLTPPTLRAPVPLSAPRTPFAQLQVKRIVGVKIPTFAASTGAVSTAAPVSPRVAVSLSFQVPSPRLLRTIPDGNLLKTRVTRGLSRGVAVVHDHEDHEVVRIGEFLATRPKHNVVKSVAAIVLHHDGTLTPERQFLPDAYHHSPELAHSPRSPAGICVISAKDEPLEIFGRHGPRNGQLAGGGEAQLL